MVFGAKRQPFSECIHCSVKRGVIHIFTVIHSFPLWTPPSSLLLFINLLKTMSHYTSLEKPEF